MRGIAVIAAVCIGLGFLPQARADKTNEHVVRLDLPRIYFGLPPPSLNFVDLGVVDIPSGAGQDKNATQAALDMTARGLGADAFIYETGNLTDIYHVHAISDAVADKLAIAAGVAVASFIELLKQSSDTSYAQGKPTGLQADRANASVPSGSTRGYFRAVKRGESGTKAIASFAPPVSDSIRAELAHAKTLQEQFTVLTTAMLTGDLPMQDYALARASLAKAAGWVP